MPIGVLFSEAEKLESAGQVDKAAQLYKSWVAFNSSDPFIHTAYFNYGVVLSRTGDKIGAINALRECIRIKPDFHPPYINLGRLLEDTGQTGLAISQWLELVKLMGEVSGESVRHKLMLLQQLGRVLEGVNMDAPAEDALRQSIDIRADQPEVVQHFSAFDGRDAGRSDVPAHAWL
jgi:predicted O-linked N-acetylglucosamine transferase (SPINDLY family)